MKHPVDLVSDGGGPSDGMCDLSDVADDGDPCAETNAAYLPRPCSHRSPRDHALVLESALFTSMASATGILLVLCNVGDSPTSRDPTKLAKTGTRGEVRLGLGLGQGLALGLGLQALGLIP